MQGATIISNPNSFLRPFPSTSFDDKYKTAMPSAPIPAYLTTPELYSIFFDKKDDIVKQNCLQFDATEGVVKMVDKETAEKHHSGITEIIKKLGKGLFSSNSIGASLPCSMFEPRSETDRTGELWRIKSYFFTKAANVSDRLERMKLVIAAEVAQSYLALRKMKSFNPILGETFQCSIADGTQVSVEQISHHPPITAYYAVGPKRCYVQGGNEEYEGSFKGNHFDFSFKTHCKITFRDGQEISWLCKPRIKAAGLIFGDTHLLIKGSEILYDKKSRIKAAIFYDYGEKKGLFGSAKTVPKDKIEGIIYVPREGAPPADGQERCVADLQDVKTELARIKGSWFENLTINEVNYWNIDKMTPAKIKLPDNPLPSDCRFREDLVCLRRGDVASADVWKDALEIRQRKDLKLREKFGKVSK